MSGTCVSLKNSSPVSSLYSLSKVPPVTKIRMRSDMRRPEYTVALIGYGNVGRALARLLRSKRRDFPFRVTGIHTLRHGTAVDPAGLLEEPAFGPRAASVDEFLDAAHA